MLVGATQSGKSTLARELHLSAAPPGVVVDPTASDICGSIPGVATFTDPRHWPDSEAGRWRFVPRDPFDTDAYDAVYREIWRRLAMGRVGGGWGNCHVWCDEAGDVLPVHRGPKAGRQYVYRAAKLMGGHLACHTRPREVDRHLFTDAHHIGIFAVDDADDRAFLASNVGLPGPDFDALLDRLPPKGFLWLNRSTRPRRLTPCPPLSLGR